MILPRRNSIVLLRALLSTIWARQLEWTDTILVNTALRWLCGCHADTHASFAAKHHDEDAVASRVRLQFLDFPDWRAFVSYTFPHSTLYTSLSFRFQCLRSYHLQDSLWRVLYNLPATWRYRGCRNVGGDETISQTRVNTKLKMYECIHVGRFLMTSQLCRLFSAQSRSKRTHFRANA